MRLSMEWTSKHEWIWIQLIAIEKLYSNLEQIFNSKHGKMSHKIVQFIESGQPRHFHLLYLHSHAVCTEVYVIRAPHTKRRNTIMGLTECHKYILYIQSQSKNHIREQSLRALISFEKRIRKIKKYVTLVADGAVVTVVVNDAHCSVRFHVISILTNFCLDRRIRVDPVVVFCFLWELREFFFMFL